MFPIKPCYSLVDFQSRKLVTAVFIYDGQLVRMDNISDRCNDRDANTAPRGRLSRRRLLAAGTTIGIAGIAGCTQAVNYIAGQVLEDVTLFNETDRQLTGSLTVTDPDESTVLDESFAVDPDTDDDDVDDDDGESGATYADVLTVAGSYTVAVELDEPVDAESTTEATVAVEAPDEEHISIVCGADDLDEAISVLVIDAFTDIGEHVDD